MHGQPPTAVDVMRSVRDARGIQVHVKAVLWSLLTRVGTEDARVWPTLDTIAADAGISRRKAVSIMQELVENNLVTNDPARRGLRIVHLQAIVQWCTACTKEHLFPKVHVVHECTGCTHKVHGVHSKSARGAHKEDKEEETKNQEDFAAQNLVGSALPNATPQSHPSEPIRNTQRWATKGDDIARIYDAYPRREGRGKALSKIEAAVGRIARNRGLSKSAAASWLLARVDAYAASELVACTERQYIPHPATWMHQARYDDPPEAWAAPAVQRAPLARQGFSEVVTR